MVIKIAGLSKSAVGFLNLAARNAPDICVAAQPDGGDVDVPVAIGKLSARVDGAGITVEYSENRPRCLLLSPKHAMFALKALARYYGPEIRFWVRIGEEADFLPIREIFERGYLALDQPIPQFSFMRAPKMSDLDQHPAQSGVFRVQSEPSQSRGGSGT